jgi:phage virion morphogenesis protein
MSDPLQQLEYWAAPLVASMQPQAQRALLRQVARDLRSAQSKRVAAQKNPDGSAFEQRKPQPQAAQKKGKARAMFGKIKQAKHLKVLQEPGGIAVGFAGRASRIARVHQYGLKDRVTPDGLQVQYAQRQLLGFTPADIDMVRSTLLKAFTA